MDSLLKVMVVELVFSVLLATVPPDKDVFETCPKGLTPSARGRSLLLGPTSSATLLVLGELRCGAFPRL